MRCSPLKVGDEHAQNGDRSQYPWLQIGHCFPSNSLHGMAECIKLATRYAIARLQCATTFSRGGSGKRKAGAGMASSRPRYEKSQRTAASPETVAAISSLIVIATRRFMVKPSGQARLDP